MSLVCFLWIASFILSLISITGKVPMWAPLILIAITGLFGCFPIH